MRLSRLFALFIFISVTLAGAPPAARAAFSGEPLAVAGVRTGEHSGVTRIVIDLNRKADFRAFHLDGPPRIVVDLPPAKWDAARSRLMSDPPLLKGYRSGYLDDGLTRIIIDLRDTAVIDKAFFLEKSGSDKDRIVIDLKPATRNMFQARLTDVFGNRDLKGGGKAPKPVSGYADQQNRIVRAAAVPPPLAAAPPPKAEAQGARKYVIVVDAGHGGGDPGAGGPGSIHEKNITLSIARELERELQESGRYKVVMTRYRDVYIPLRDRVDIARRVKADLFISIHADKIDRTGVRGASIYTLSEKASDTETQRLADSENNAGFVAGVDLAAESQDVADILLDLAMRQKMNDSKVLSQALESSFLNNNVRLLPNSHRSAGFAVLKAPDVPAALIETGFLSNDEDAKLLTTSQFQQRIASAIIDGVDAYFRKMRALQKI